MPLFHPMDSSSPYPWDCITIPWDSTTRSLRTLEQPHSWDSTNLPLGFQHPTPEIPLSPFWYSIATPLRFHYPALRISAPLSWLLVYGSQKSFFASRASPIALLLPCSNLQTPLFNELLKISCNDFYNSKNPSKFFFFLVRNGPVLWHLTVYVMCYVDAHFWGFLDTSTYTQFLIFALNSCTVSVIAAVINIRSNNCGEGCHSTSRCDGGKWRI